MKQLKIGGSIIGLLAVLVCIALWMRPAIPATSTDEASYVKPPLSQRIADRFEQEFNMTVDPATGTVPRERLYKAMKVAEQRRAQIAGRSGVVPVYWEERGPDNVGGRTRAILIDANDPSGRTVWAGSVSGGLWRTTDIDDASPTWTVINDLFQNLAISTIVQDPTNSNNLFFGTGECWGNQDAVRGMGVWRSTDGGATWALMSDMTPTGNPCINKLIFDAAGTLYAATNQGMLRYDAVDDDWNLIFANGLFTNFPFVTDVELAANGDFYVSTSRDGVYRSTDGGTVWNPLSGGLPISGYGRIELACAPSNSAVVYVIYADTANATSGQCLSVLRSGDSGTTWSSRTCPGNFGSQAWYDLILAVDPNDPNRLWAGGVRLSVSGNGGTSWTAVNGIHADHHAIVYYPGDSEEILFGNDGGVYKVYDGSSAVPTPEDRNDTYNVTQFYAAAIHPDAGSNYMLGGTQDNATPKFEDPGMNSTSCVLCCCDGGWTFIDEDDPSIQIASTQNGSFSVSTDGGNAFNNIVPGSNPRLFITPADYDDDVDILYYSDTRGRLGRVTDIGGTNTATSDTIAELNNRRVSALATSPSVANRLYIGTERGVLLQVDNAHQAGMVAVTDLGLPATRFISSIAIDPNDEEHLLVTQSNYGQPSVFETYDGGDTWDIVEGDLPDMPVRWVMFHPFDSDQALIATELGVWSTDDLNGADTEWFPTNTYGLANVKVSMLQYRPSDHRVVAATHGRGMYTTDYFGLLETCVLNRNVPGSVSPGIYMAENEVTSDGTVPSGNSVVYQAGSQVILEENFHAEAGSFFVAAIQDCGSQLDMLATDEDEMADRTVADGTPSLTNELKCYPNPVSFQMTIEAEVAHGSWYQLYVKDPLGHTVATVAPSTLADGEQARFELNADRFAAGYYILVLQTDDGAVSKKFVVVR